jgi:hypothetical protein
MKTSMIATTSKRALVVALVLCAQGCYFHFKRGGIPPVLPKDYATPSDRASRPGFGPKLVSGKEPPTRLLARDGTSCVVTQKKYDSAVLGQSIWCSWIDTNR